MKFAVKLISVLDNVQFVLKLNLFNSIFYLCVFLSTKEIKP